jgi:hypothetical protein
LAADPVPVPARLPCSAANRERRKVTGRKMREEAANRWRGEYRLEAATPAPANNTLRHQGFQPKFRKEGWALNAGTVSLQPHTKGQSLKTSTVSGRAKTARDRRQRPHPLITRCGTKALTKSRKEGWTLNAGTVSLQHAAYKRAEPEYQHSFGPSRNGTRQLAAPAPANNTPPYQGFQQKFRKEGWTLNASRGCGRE